MSLLDTASLIVTPNGYKEGKLYSVIPSDGSGDLSVTRATTATRVNSQGLVELVPYNLNFYSEDLSNAWYNKFNSSISTNSTTAPNGTNTADKIIENTSNTYHYVETVNSLNGGQYHTISAYLKKAERDFGYIGVYTFESKQIRVNLTNGTIDNTTGTWINTDIEDAGNGWYRVSGTFDAYSTSYFFAGPALNATTPIYTGNGTSGIYLWGAQLVEGSVAKDYQKTETRLNIPRLDYSNGTCPSILVEPQRTNMCVYSNDLTGWINQIYNTTLTRIQTGGPDGNAFDRLVTTGSGNQGRYVQTSFLTGSNAIFSVYLKGSGIADITIYNAGQSSSDTITLTSEWTRYETKITSGTNGYIDWSIFSYGGSTIDVAFSQMEFATYATSYIPTTSASVTRNADVISKTGISSLIGQTEGTLFFDLEFPQNQQASYIGISDGTTGNRIILGCESGAFYTFGYGFSTLSLNTNTRYKIAMAYNSTNMKIYANGTLLATVSGAVPSGMSRFAFDSGANTQHLIADVYACSLWKTKLTDTQLATLTTI